MEQGNHKKPVRKAKKISRRQNRVFVDESCTGCCGAPICQIYCKTGALRLRRDVAHPPFFRMEVDPELCTGCGACVQRGPKGQALTGCPWDAIRIEPANHAIQQEGGVRWKN